MEAPTVILITKTLGTNETAVSEYLTQVCYNFDLEGEKRDAESCGQISCDN